MIMAISDNDVIGVNNELPWRLPFDLKWFKMNTYQCANGQENLGIVTRKMEAADTILQFLRANKFF